jgi:uncharacterized protein (UPF0332 family)
MFDWTEYQKLADALAQDPAEAALRSAISRAYYYAFHVAKDYVEAKFNKRFQKEGAHTAVWQALAAGPPGQLRLEVQAGMKGQRIRVKRNSADYDKGMANPASECTLVLSDAQAIARLLAEAAAQSR